MLAFFINLYATILKVVVLVKKQSDVFISTFSYSLEKIFLNKTKINNNSKTNIQ